MGCNVEDTPLSATLEVDGTNPSPINPALGHYLRAEVENVTNGEFAVLLGRTIPTAHPREDITASNLMSELIRAKGDPDLNVHFAFNMPLRALAKLTNGTVSTDMIDAAVEVINGHFWRGITRLAIRYCANARANKATQRELDQTR